MLSPMEARGSIWAGTLRSLAAPRRIVPVLVVAAALAVTELGYTGSAAAAALDLALCLVFWLVGPASWRWLCAGRGSGESAAWGYAAYLTLGATVVGLGGGLGPRLLGLPFTFATDLGSLGVLAVLYLVGGWGLGRDIELEEGLVEERRRAERLGQEASRAQLLALRANLDPHFLFNTLNAIAEWCREDPLVAEAALLRLATMLRSVLAGVREPAWPLARELDLVTDLIELYRVRDPGRYAVDLALPDPLPEAAVPPMILLPLVENALTHGPAAGHRGTVRLSVVAQGDRVRVELRNPGPFRGRREGGEGIAMVERRLALAYGDAAHLVIHGEVGGARRGGEPGRGPGEPEEETATIVDLPRTPPFAGREGAGRDV
jgi:hypothetical protein